MEADGGGPRLPAAGRGLVTVGGRRFEEFLDEVFARHPAGDIVVVSHGGVTVDLVRNLVGDDALRRDAPDLLRDGLPACAVTTVAGGPGHWRALGIGVPSG